MIRIGEGVISGIGPRVVRNYLRYYAAVATFCLSIGVFVRNIHELAVAIREYTFLELTPTRQGSSISGFPHP